MSIKINIPKNPALAVKMLIDAGFEAGVVGGLLEMLSWMKYLMIGIFVHQLPLMKYRWYLKRFRQLTMGLKHGTVVIIIDGEDIEITTYRVDGEYSDGRRPDNVAFTRNLVEDLSRRDYTQNAIFYNDITRSCRSI